MKNKRSSNGSGGALILLLVMAAVAAFIWGCTSPDTAQRILEEEGYENIEVGGYAMFGCTESSTWATSFEATRNGRPVEGAVCCSFMTCEVRLY